jgi:hypothetical protein
MFPSQYCQTWVRSPSPGHQLFRSVQAGEVERTTKKFHNQFDAVDKALAGARIRRGVTSAGYSQVIPNQPIENQVLKRNRQRTEMTCAAVLSFPTEMYRPARTTKVAPMAIEVEIINFLRPSRSMRRRATRLFISGWVWRQMGDVRCKEVDGSIYSCDDSGHFWS